MIVVWKWIEDMDLELGISSGCSSFRGEDKAWLNHFMDS